MRSKQSTHPRVSSRPSSSSSGPKVARAQVPPPAPPLPPAEPEVAAPAQAKTVTTEERREMIARLAYCNAERSGFTCDPVGNWLAAEREVDAALTANAAA